MEVIDSVCEKHISSFSRPACIGNLAWWNLREVAELKFKEWKIQNNEEGAMHGTER